MNKKHHSLNMQLRQCVVYISAFRNLLKTSKQFLRIWICFVETCGHGLQNQESIFWYCPSLKNIGIRQNFKSRKRLARYCQNSSSVFNVQHNLRDLWNQRSHHVTRWCDYKVICTMHIYPKKSTFPYNPVCVIYTTLVALRSQNDFIRDI